MTTLTQLISNCRSGVCSNPYQGADRKVVFVCSAGILRSATAARLYAKKYNTRSAGTYDIALVPLTPVLLKWADRVVFVNKENYEMALAKFPDLKEQFFEEDLVVLDIPDQYEHMHPKLIEAFKEQFEDF